MGNTAVAFGLAAFAAAATVSSPARAPSAQPLGADTPIAKAKCATGRFAGRANRVDPDMEVNGKALPSKLLRNGDRVRVRGRGYATVCLVVGRTKCHLYQGAQVQVQPSDQDLIWARGRVSCGSNNVQVRIQLKRGGVLIRTQSGFLARAGATSATTADPVFSLSVTGTRALVKMTRGGAIVTRGEDLENAVVVGRGRQIVVTAGGEPKPTQPIKLTKAERAAVTSIERGLPKETDKEKPGLDLTGPPSSFSVRHATFQFSSKDATAVFSCALDGVVFRLCTSPEKVTGLRPGEHRFSVRATDPAGNTREGFVKWIVDDKRIAFTSFRDGNPELYTVDPDGKNLKRVTTDVGKLISDEDPDWAPDRRRLAFERLGDGDLDIYVVNEDGSGLTRLTSDRARDQNPTWSPDGTKIVFESYRAGGNRDLYVMNANGSGVTRLTTDQAEDLDATWSPDGRRIAFASTRDGNFEIYVMNADGSGQTRLTNEEAQDLGPSWSPDGKRIVFQSRRVQPYYNLYVMNPDGSGVTRVTRTEQDDQVPAWAPDNRHIVFQSNRPERGNEAQLYIVDADTGEETPLIPEPVDPARRICYLPDW